MRRVGLMIAAAALAVGVAAPQVGRAQGAVALYRAKGRFDFVAQPMPHPATAVRGTVELTLARVGDRPLGLRAPSRGVLSMVVSARAVQVPPSPCRGLNVIVDEAQIAWEDGTSSAGRALVALSPDIGGGIYMYISTGRFARGSLNIVARFTSSGPQCDARFNGLGVLL